MKITDLRCAVIGKRLPSMTPGAEVLIAVPVPRHSTGESGFGSQNCICGGPPGIQTTMTLLAFEGGIPGAATARRGR